MTRAYHIQRLNAHTQNRRVGHPLVQVCSALRSWGRSPQGLKPNYCLALMSDLKLRPPVPSTFMKKQVPRCARDDRLESGISRGSERGRILATGRGRYCPIGRREGNKGYRAGETCRGVLEGYASTEKTLTQRTPREEGRALRSSEVEDRDFKGDEKPKTHTQHRRVGHPLVRVCSALLS
jgi:hypothetical protein